MYNILMHNNVIIPKRDKRLTLRETPRLGGQELVGERALLAAVIGLAVRDYLAGDEQQSEDAAAYFMSKEYRNHLQWLDLPDDYIPQALGIGGVYT